MNNTKIAIGLSVVAIVIAIIAYGHTGSSLGNKTASFWDSVQGYRVNGTEVFTSGGFLAGATTGTCSLIGSVASIPASTTVAFDCAVTGIVSGDITFSQFATTTASSGGPGWLITQSSASTTSGFLTLNVTNLTGTTATMPASLSTAVKYFVSK